MNGYVGSIEESALNNTDFRQVVFTAKHMQLVLMTLQPSEDIGMETHPDTDQFFSVVCGQGKVVIDGVEKLLHQWDVVLVPAGSAHNVINISATQLLHLFTLYAPAHHPADTEHKTKADAIGGQPVKESAGVI